MTKRFFFIGLLVIALSTAEGGSKCPSREIYPCNCYEIPQQAETFTLVTCSRFNDSSQFLNIPRLLDRMMIDRLILEDFNSSAVAALTLPEGWFANIRFRDLELHNVKLSGEICQSPETFFKGQEATMVKVSLKKSLASANAALFCRRCTGNNNNYYYEQGSTVDLSMLSLATKLKELDLSWNKISSVGSQALPTQLNVLEIIDLSHNIIKTIDTASFRSLQKLHNINLSYNMITTLPSNMFGSQISALDFSHNLISIVPKDMFSGTLLQNLTRVLFAHNNLQDLPMDTWLPAVRIASTVDVSDNFLTCTSVAWIRSQVKSDSQVIGSCVNPGEMETRALRNATAK